MPEKLTTPSIIDKTTPEAIAEAKKEKIHLATRIAGFLKARSKARFFKNLVFGEAEHQIKDIIKDPMSKISSMAFYDELEKIANSDV